MRVLRTSLIFAVALASSSSFAAEIEAVPLGNDAARISVRGDIDFNDGERFEALALRYKSAIVALDSPGGSTIAGIQIGKAVRLRGFTTLVESNAVCASACGLAWLGGAELVAEPGSAVGFHTTYIERLGMRVETGVGNAIVGAYLNQMGLTTSLIAELLSAGPDSIKWLTPELGAQFGLQIATAVPDAAYSVESGDAPKSPIVPEGKEDNDYRKDDDRIDGDRIIVGDETEMQVDRDGKADFGPIGGEGKADYGPAPASPDDLHSPRPRTKPVTSKGTKIVSGNIIRRFAERHVEMCAFVCSALRFCTAFELNHKNSGVCTLYSGRVQLVKQDNYTSGLMR